jgi:hypothetical protein
MGAAHSPQLLVPDLYTDHAINQSWAPYHLWLSRGNLVRPTAGCCTAAAAGSTINTRIQKERDSNSATHSMTLPSQWVHALSPLSVDYPIATIPPPPPPHTHTSPSPLDGRASPLIAAVQPVRCPHLSASSSCIQNHRRGHHNCSAAKSVSVCLILNRITGRMCTTK